ncbi:MAG TPA: hypothetical protein VGD71_36050 [Kribbella sp.]
MTTGRIPGRTSVPTPAVLGIAQSMRARDVSRPRPENRTKAERKTDTGQAGSGGSSPVAS